MKHVKRTNKWAALPLVLLLAAGARAEQTLTEVTVSGQVPELEEQRTAVTQKIILDRQAIAATGGLTVGEVLGKLPGVDAGIPGSDGMSSLKARGWCASRCRCWWMGSGLRAAPVLPCRSSRACRRGSWSGWKS